MTLNSKVIVRLSAFDIRGICSHETPEPKTLEN